ncbi:hypothetical protein F5J12DRAFT_785921 [Pisolithus orientalis]|uniref:uncharacterized protein n=1 Tax=Pisolithus orientalis TaxID=936130 RepID=UPI0022245FD5|nr:uncharacterized protein F5J12DRAFT_785921 [Pisolithus orientalis]KAI5993792.1 hypothetical protein F5J12DRAFT_785921 [Pisolithus orientalis]
MQAYSVNNTHPVFSMRDQVATALAATLGHVWDLIEMVPQPEERLEMIYAWVEDWDKIWTGIHSWWKYIDNNGITIPKVCNKCMHDYTKESAMCQNLLSGEGRVERAARGGEVDKGTFYAHTQSGSNNNSTGKGKGKEKATDKVDELENNEGNRPPNPDPSKTGAPAPECKNAGSGGTAAGLSHKRTKSVTVMMMTETLVTTGLKLQIPARKPPPRQNSELTPVHPTPRASPPLLSDMPPPPLTLPPMDNPGDLGDCGLFGRPTGLLDNPPTPVVSTQDKSEGPPVEETPQIANPSELTTHETLAECIQLLEGRADDEEFELTQIHQMLGLLVMQVERQIGAVQGRCEELKRLKDQLKDM